MREVSITACALALAFGVTACGQKSDDAKSATAGEGAAYSTTTHTTKQADAAPGSLRAGTIPENPGAPNPQATTGGAAGGMTQATPVVPFNADSAEANRAAGTRAGTTNQTPKNTPADGRVDPR
ncbi:hypothetical protein P7B02_09990 [Caulobacter segnis]|uniref:hypothetical protein n=1 Tax=Caulobacter segnis TaxID=88688 RepID=UPI002410AE55|nr:hypothetical protein [Caulobacter segnis]MDG2521873.1 hypothetical protein [Caulobacter segnis]